MRNCRCSKLPVLRQKLLDFGRFPSSKTTVKYNLRFFLNAGTVHFAGGRHPAPSGNLSFAMCFHGLKRAVRFFERLFAILCSIEKDGPAVRYQPLRKNRSRVCIMYILCQIRFRSRYPGLPSTQDSQELFNGMASAPCFRAGLKKAVILPAGVRSRTAAAHPVFRDAWRQRPGNRLDFAA